MLHMVVNTHSPESCAFRSKEDADVLTEAMERVEVVAAENDASIQGFWVNRAGHEFFMLIDAPNAHVVDEIIVASGAVGRTHTRVMSVVSSSEAIASVER